MEPVSLNLRDLVPLIEAQIPFLYVQECVYEEDNQSYSGLAFIPQLKPTKHGSVYMTTLVIVGDDIIFGIHGVGERTTNMCRKVHEVNQDELIGVLRTVWLPPVN